MAAPRRPPRACVPPRHLNRLTERLEHGFVTVAPGEHHSAVSRSAVSLRRQLEGTRFANTSQRTVHISPTCPTPLKFPAHSIDSHAFLRLSEARPDSRAPPLPIRRRQERTPAPLQFMEQKVPIHALCDWSRVRRRARVHRQAAPPAPQDAATSSTLSVFTSDERSEPTLQRERSCATTTSSLRTSSSVISRRRFDLIDFGFAAPGHPVYGVGPASQPSSSD